jgi:adenosine/AMP kinase
VEGLKVEVVEIEKPAEVNVIVGLTHFIKSVEDIYEAVVNSVPGAKFGLAFVEASGKRLIRHDGTDEELEELAVKNALKIGAGHSFVLLLRNLYPINVLNALKSVPEVTCVIAATANPLRVIVADLGDSRAILGVADGQKPLGVEGPEDIAERKEFLRKIGYKR